MVANTETGEQRLWEPTPLTKITDKQLTAAISCPGLLEHFKAGELRLSGKIRRRVSGVTGGMLWERRGTIPHKSGSNYEVVTYRDLDSVGIVVYDHEHNVPIVRLGLRDRRSDGSVEATSPFYLRTIGKIDDYNIPPRSFSLGATNWYYSSPIFDGQQEGKRAAEISIVSSDPSKLVIHRLMNKDGKLWVKPKKLWEFIDDPFAFIPLHTPTSEKLNEWYRMWWQVMNRALRGKTIPLPGQTSEAGFSGFFNHVVASSSQLLKEHGFTHLSAIPTWYYVWKIFIIKGGFESDDNNAHRMTVDFLNRMGEINWDIFPVSSLDEKDPILSWLAVLPYALALNPRHAPDIGSDVASRKHFLEVYDAIRDVMVMPDGQVMTYPLFPGRNLWYSRPV